jgi:hypothetical protein
VLIGTLYSQGLVQALNDPVLVGFSRLDVFDFGLVARPTNRIEELLPGNFKTGQ